MTSQEQENRNWERFVVEGCLVELRVSDETSYHAMITDDSYGGLGVEIWTPECDVQPGQRILIETEGGTLAAFARFVLQRSNQNWKIGLEWEHPGPFRTGPTPWIGGDDENAGSSPG